MVAYNLFLALFPFALLVLFIFGRVIQSTSVEESVIADLQGLFPAVELNTLRNTLARHPRQLDHDRPRGGDRRDLDRDLVLGRHGHRLLPHLPRPVPGLAGAEALRAPDAARGDAVPGGQRGRSHPRGRPRLQRRRPSVRPLRIDEIAKVLLLIAALAVTFLLCCVIYYPCPRATCRGTGCGPARCSSP